MVTLTNALIMFAFGYVHALYNTSKHMGRKGGLEVVFRNDYVFFFFMNIITRTVNTKSGL